MPTRPRENQRARTRKDLLRAAAELLGEGLRPSLSDVAERAQVSRATAYRYFPSIEALCIEALIDATVPSPESLFAADASVDPEERVDRAEGALHEVVYANEVGLRATLAHALAPRQDGAPARQNRRLPLIEAALEPLREELPEAAYERLCHALCLVFGVESMIVCRDVLGIDAQAARELKSWVVRALVRAAREG
jgi:AcrR family transcriptional regulator